MFIEVRPQAYDTDEQIGISGPFSEWPMEVIPSDLSGKPVGFAVERLAGANRFREAYQTATGTWVGAD